MDNSLFEVNTIYRELFFSSRARSIMGTCLTCGRLVSSCFTKRNVIREQAAPNYGTKTKNGIVRKRRTNVRYGQNNTVSDERPRRNNADRWPTTYKRRRRVTLNANGRATTGRFIRFVKLLFVGNPILYGRLRLSNRPITKMYVDLLAALKSL